MRPFFYMVVIMFSLQTACVYAQQDTVQLDTAWIMAEKKWLFASGSFSVTTDTNLNKFFSGQMITQWPLPPSLIVKNYGPGGISTASMRGLESRHTSVIWNGIQINSPSLGLTDLALVAPSPNADITLFHGNASSLFHTTSSGSALIIDEKIRFGKYFSASASFENSSLQNKKYLTGLSFSGNQFYQSLFLNWQQSENKFRFVNNALPGSPEQQQQHATEEHRIINGQTAWKISSKEELTFFWNYQNSKREIPPMMTQSLSNAFLQDSLLKLLLRFRKIFSSSFSVHAKAALLTGSQQYSDSISKIFSDNSYVTQYYEAGSTCVIMPSLTLKSGLVLSQTRFDFSDYQNERFLNDYSAFGSLLFDKNRFTTTFHVRKSWRNTENLPWTVSGGLTFQATDRLQLRARAASSLQLPTGNDLYWKPGGNPALKPEHCLSAETGADFSLNKLINGSFTLYRNEIKDWIQWLPVQGGYYAPFNIKQVRTQGVESCLSAMLAFRSLKIKLSAFYTYSHAVNRTTGPFPADDLFNKQLIYIPKHSGSSSVELFFRKLVFMLHYHGNGLRYTTADHLYYLPAYHLFQCAWRYEFQYKTVQFNPVFRISNLTNESYQSMAWRPMPGRNYTLGLTISFHHSNNKTKSTL